MSITVEWRFLIQYRQRARNSRTFSNGFLPWPLRTEISPVSLNLFTILLTVDGDRPRFFAILRWDTLFFNWQTILSRSSALRGEPRPILAEKGRVVSTVLWRFSLMDQSPPLLRRHFFLLSFPLSLLEVRKPSRLLLYRHQQNRSVGRM